MKFGTSGLRGLVTDLEGRASALYTMAFVRHLASAGLLEPGGSVLVARDFRSSSPSIAATVLGTLAREGFRPIDCGTIPTPALALFGMKISAPSLMITGSHIPDDRNGIKFYRADGEIDKHDELSISAMANTIASDIDCVIDFSPGAGVDTQADVQALFMARYSNIIAPKALAGLKIGVYQHSTVARDMMVEVLKRHGASIVALGRSEHFIPVDTEAVSGETIALMRSWSREHKLDAIVSADGDGDRPLVSDETGTPLRGDLLGLIAGLFLNADIIVTPVTSNSGVEAAGSYTVTRTKVGSPYVIAGMQEAINAGEHRVMGFEANGGVLVGTPFDVGTERLEPLPTRDSFLPILAVLAFAAADKQLLSEVASGFSLPSAAADRLENFPVVASQALMAMLRSSPTALSEFLAPISNVVSTSDIDGLRVGLSNGQIVHYRPSGNAPEMRCYVEAENAPAADELLQKGMSLVRAWADKHVA